jgi:hypothetical protein
VGGCAGRIEAIAEDGEHLTVVGQHLRHEEANALLLGLGRQSDDQDRRQALVAMRL